MLLLSINPSLLHYVVCRYIDANETVQRLDMLPLVLPGKIRYHPHTNVEIAGFALTVFPTCAVATISQNRTGHLQRQFIEKGAGGHLN
jgi:hypothetical protein